MTPRQLCEARFLYGVGMANDGTLLFVSIVAKKPGSCMGAAPAATQRRDKMLVSPFEQADFLVGSNSKSPRGGVLNFLKLKYSVVESR